MNPVLRSFGRMLDELDSAKIDYMVMGGWAVQVWGRPRPTFDVEELLVVQRGTGGLDEEYLSAWAARLGVSERLARF